MIGRHPHHDLFVCCPVCSLFLSPSFGKTYALNPVDEFTEVQESGNHLQSSTSAEVTFGFQHEFFLAWMGTSSKMFSSLVLAGKQKYVFYEKQKNVFSGKQENVFLIA